MGPPADREAEQSGGAGGLQAEDFKRQLFLQLQSSGVVNSLKSQLRTQMLSQLQSKYAAGVSPPDTETPSLARRAINSLIAEYLSSSKYHYALSVFQPESGLTTSSSAPLSAAEILQVMHLSKSTAMYQALDRRGAAPGPAQLTHQAHDSAAAAAAAAPGYSQCLMMEIFESIQEVNDRVLNDSSTQTYEEGGFRLGTQLQLLEDRFSALSKAAASNPFRTLEERMGAYRREVDERSKQEVTQQVERVRELEISAVRLEEATKFRRALEQERQELERVFADRNAKLREREEAQSERLRRQHRDVEGAAFEHRQRIVKEEDRLRAWRGEVQLEVNQKTEALQQRISQVEAREATVTAREAEAERRHVEATQMVTLAEERAGRKAKEELHVRREELQRDRLAVESERAQLMELRTEAMTELTNARATQEKLRAMTAVKDAAELRAKAAESADEASRLKLERAMADLEDMTRAKRNSGLPTGGDPDASFLSAASFGHMLNAPQGAPSLAETATLKDALKRSEQARKRFQREARSLREQVQVLQERESPIALAMQRSQQLLDEGLESQEGALSAMEDMELSFNALCRQVEDLQASNSRLRRDHLKQLSAGSSGREPPATPAAATALPPTHVLSELKHQVHSLRRDLDQHRRKVQTLALSALVTEVEDQRWRAAREHVDVTKSARKPRARAVNFDLDKENYDHDYDDTDTDARRVHSPSLVMQREALLQAFHSLQASQGAMATYHQPSNVAGPLGPGDGVQQPMYSPQITPGGFAAHLQAPPAGYVEAVINGQRVLVPASTQASAPGPLHPLPTEQLPSFAPPSPLRDYILHQSVTPQSAHSIPQVQSKFHASSVRPKEVGSPESHEVLSEPSVGPYAPAAPAAEAEAADLQDLQAQQEEAERQRALQAERDVADQMERQQQAALQAKRREQEEERARLETERARQEEAMALRRKKQKQEEAETLKSQEPAPAVRLDSAKEPAEAVDEKNDQAANDFLAAAAAADAEEEKRMAEEAMARRAAMEARRQAADEQRRRAAAEEEQAQAVAEAQRAEEERAKAAAAAAREEEKAKRAAAEEEEAASKEREVQAQQEADEAAREKQEKDSRLEEYRRKKEEQRRREEEELLAAMADADDVSVPSQSDGEEVEDDFADLDYLSGELDSLPPDLDEIRDLDASDAGSVW